MKKIYILPIESVAGRYTKQWRDNIPGEFVKAGFDVEVIDGEQLTDFVGTGTFLDIHTTIHYKNNQIQQVANLFATKQVKDGDIFWLADLEFWGGVESIRLLAQMNKLDVKIYAFCHAASYTTEDAFAVASYHQKYTELGWIAACDKVFVGSLYHKNAIIERRINPLASIADRRELCDKIVVTGNPIFASDYILPVMPVKKKQIILPNRFDWEKRPNISLDLAYILKKEIPDLEIVVTTSHPKFKSNREWLTTLARGMEADGIITIKENLTKEEYHTIMAESMIMMSNSIEENFGICIIEAMVYGTYPLLPRGLSHTELTLSVDEFLYDDLDQVLDKVKLLLSIPTQILKPYMLSQVAYYNQSLTRMIDAIKG
jgi:glycosyltransferase involved in cell wall biosynthesis